VAIDGNILEDTPMKLSHTLRKTKLLRILITIAFVVGLLWSYPGRREPMKAQTTPNTAQQTTSPTPQISAEELRQRDDWRVAMAQLPLPSAGCFQATFPNRNWQNAPCTTAPPYPMIPPNGPRPLIVGNRDDVSAQAPTGFISMGIGTFDSVTGVTSETGLLHGATPMTANSYSLQLNMNTFTSTACAGSPNPGCRGWEQFVFSNDNTRGFAFIQYWLIQYNATCPAATPAWIPFSFPGSTDIYCFKNAANSSRTPNETIANLINLSLSGSVSATGDSYAFSDGTRMFAATGDNVVNAAAGWNIAEFNIFGDSNGDQANFNAGAAINPRTRIIYGGTAPPPCVARGFTGETNNLSFGPTAPTPTGPGPAVLFSESSGGGAGSNCMAAVSVGDTHLATFNGLFYDFQASGDFVLAQTDQDFVVQTRQVSGAPTWPDASVNSAVATRMGNSQVAVCLPSQLKVDGKNTEIADGKSFSTADGVDIWRRGNVYIITDPSGNSVRATLNSSYIDVSVGLGRWPTNVSGLLANAGGDVNKLAARDGTVFTNAFDFQDLYQRFGESWRVSPRESLLSACGGDVQSGNPGRPFFAKDLEPNVRERARAVCIAAGVKGDAFLDACTLDVAVIGKDDAAKVFTTLPQPIAVGNITGGSRGLFGGLGVRHWLWLLLIILLIVFLLIFLLRRRYR
jgi:hypothetical protein